MADALSGFMIYAEKDFTRDQTLSLFIAQEAAFNSGDFEYTNPTHHGTPKERLAAFRYGFDNAEDYISGQTVEIGRFLQDSAAKYGVPKIRW